MPQPKKKPRKVFRRRPALKVVHPPPKPARPSAPPRPPLGPDGAPLHTYDPARDGLLFLGLESFARHMTDEGWQLQEGLRLAGYQLWGRGYGEYDEVDVPVILEKTAPARIGTVIVQDKREWDPSRPGCFDKNAEFRRFQHLAAVPDLFRVTICKDAQQDPPYHSQFAADIGCHAWIVYYHPDAVCRLAPYVRRKHVIRTWHSIDSARVPPYADTGRDKCILSGSLSRSYPLRRRLAQHGGYLPITVITHPGYHAEGVASYDFLFVLSKYKVSICTASIYGYALRKIIESTAAGCVVITDLPVHDALPEIDGNLIRVKADVSLHEIAAQIEEAAGRYDPERQRHYAELAKGFYDYRRRGQELSVAIAQMRAGYGGAA